MHVVCVFRFLIHIILVAQLLIVALNCMEDSDLNSDLDSDSTLDEEVNKKDCDCHKEKGVIRTRGVAR